MSDKCLHDKAWQLLEDKGLKIGERMMIRSAFVDWSGYREEYPFINAKYKEGKIKYYYSEYEPIKHIGFNTENEAILANAIYLNMGESFEVNEFRHVFKYTCKIVGIKQNQ